VQERSIGGTVFETVQAFYELAYSAVHSPALASWADRWHDLKGWLKALEGAVRELCYPVL